MWIGVKNCNTFCSCLALRYFEGRGKPDESRIPLLFNRKSYPIVELILKNSRNAQVCNQKKLHAHYLMESQKYHNSLSSKHIHFQLLLFIISVDIMKYMLPFYIICEKLIILGNYLFKYT